MAIEPAAVRAALGDPALPLYLFDKIDSTSNECRRRLSAGEGRCLVLAECQTAGRGRRGKSFFSPAGAGLYMSLLFRPEGGPAAALGVTTYAAVCVAETVAALTGTECGIKWVNDLYLDGRKVCGILTEAVGGAVIVGIGVNLTRAAAPEGLEQIVGWIGRGDVRDALAGRIAGALLRYAPGDTSHMDAYRSRSVVLGRRVRFALNGAEREGVAAAIADDGALTVQTADGPVVLRGGEISLTGIEGIK